MKELYISVVDDFSPTPGGRYARDGKWSGEEFRKQLVEPRLLDVMQAGGKIIINLDGTAGYATSFLEEAFGGLVRDLKRRISPYLTIVTENSVRQMEVEKYVQDAELLLK